MVSRLVRERRIQTPRVLWAFLRVRRHEFVPESLGHACYGPGAHELVDGQTLTCPDFVAQMVTLLRVRPGDRVLEVGTGTGYQAAILAACRCDVTTLEVRPTLHAQAARNLASRSNVVLRLGDGGLGAPDRAPFDAIVLGCAVAAPPDALLAQLAPGGRLVMPEGDPSRMQTLVRLTRTAQGVERTAVRAAWFVPMWRPGDPTVPSAL